MYKKLVTTLLFACATATLFAQQVDEAYNQKIKEFTTDSRFLPSSVLNLIADPKIPSPLKQFNQIIGAPSTLHRTDEAPATALLPLHMRVSGADQRHGVRGVS